MSDCITPANYSCNLEWKAKWGELQRQSLEPCLCLIMGTQPSIHSAESRWIDQDIFGLTKESLNATVGHLRTYVSPQGGFFSCFKCGHISWQGICSTVWLNGWQLSCKRKTIRISCSRSKYSPSTHKTLVLQNYFQSF